MEKKRNKILIYFAIIILILIILNISMQFSWINKTEDNENNENKLPGLIKEGDKIIINMELPAVDEEGNGVATELKIQAEKGTGKTLVDIDNLLFWADTQQSIRIARLVAGNITNRALDDYDLIYSIKANASLIGGPSAGAALTIATIAALEGKEPKSNVMITGTINHDGSIGPVSSILEKAKASKRAGADILLVPLLQSRDVIYETSEHCEEFGVSEVCTTETKPTKINVTEESGVNVIEVGSVEEAMKYFFLN